MDWERFVNEPANAATTPQFNLQRGDGIVRRPSMQPHLERRHRAADMPQKLRLLAVIAACLGLLFTTSGRASAQPAATPAPADTSTVSTTIRPALSQVAQTLNSLNIRKWKAPNPVRDEATSNVAAIQRDINGTLATLLQQADASPTSVPAAFSVYRNVDALYDTLLRVVETAELAAPDNESNQLEATLKTLENARANLGDAILTGTQNEQAEVARLRSALASASASTPQHTSHTTVVDDGPAPAKTHHRSTSSRNKTTKTTGQSDKDKQNAKPQP
jgi:hypothetical protein